MIEPKYQTFWPRFWAGAVDGIVFYPLSLVNRLTFREGVPLWARAAWYVIASLSFIAYVVIMHARFGQTLGKMATGVRVLDLSEAKLLPRQAFMREVVPLALVLVALPSRLRLVLAGRNLYKPESIQGLGARFWIAFWLVLAANFGWFVAELITMLTNVKRRAVHDFIARSVVVRNIKPQEREFGGVV